MKLQTLIGSVNGTNRIFKTSAVINGTNLNVLINGITYPKDDQEYGFTKIDDITIELNVAPKTGDVVMAYYENVKSVGSAIDPSGNYS